MISDQAVRFWLDSIPVNEMTVWQNRLLRLRNDCGCGVGSIVTLTITGGWIVHVVSSSMIGETWQHEVEVGFGVLLASAVAGKLIGLALARLRWEIAARDLRHVAQRYARQS